MLEYKNSDGSLSEHDVGCTSSQPSKVSDPNTIFQKKYKTFMRKVRPRVKVMKGNALWNKILKEHADEAIFLEDPEEPIIPHGIDTKEWLYLSNELLPTLLPALEEALLLAKRLKVEEGRFRAFDYMETLVHYMLNLNVGPTMPIKKIEDLEEVKDHFMKHPRPAFPRNVLWSRRKAATIIQKNVRGWLVRKRPDVQEMREFWMVMRKEMLTRKGSVIPPSEAMHLYLGVESSSETDVTLYNDEKQFFKYTKIEKEGEKAGLNIEEMKLPPINLKEEEISKLTSLPPELRKEQIQKLWDEYKAKESETTLSGLKSHTEEIVYGTQIGSNEMSPFVQEKSQLAAEELSYESNFSKSNTTMKSEKLIKKPEISSEDAESAISYENLIIPTVGKFNVK